MLPCAEMKLFSIVPSMLAWPGYRPEFGLFRVRDVGQERNRNLSRRFQQLRAKAREESSPRRTSRRYGSLLPTPASTGAAFWQRRSFIQPQSAILWMGKIMETPVAREGQVVIRSMMYLLSLLTIIGS